MRPSAYRQKWASPGRLGIPQLTRNLADGEPPNADTAKAVLTLLADAEARTILQAAESEPRSVAELVEASGIPTSTAYRKIDDLVGADLLEERIRIRTDGHNASEYVTRVASVTVTFSEAEGLEVAYQRHPADRDETHRDTKQEAAAQLEVVTDGGEDANTDVDAG